MRADAQRNHDQLVAAAREVFAERGAAAPLDEIARRAGIGNATMYRHFPTRRDLIIAVYADEVAVLCAQGDALAAAESPGDALWTWLAEFVAHVATKQELALAIPKDGRRSTLFDDWHDAMRTTATKLVERARAAGCAATDLDVPDLLVLAGGIAVASADADQARRCLAMVRHGVGG